MPFQCQAGHIVTAELIATCFNNSHFDSRRFFLFAIDRLGKLRFLIGYPMPIKIKVRLTTTLRNRYRAECSLSLTSNLIKKPERV